MTAGRTAGIGAFPKVINAGRGAALPARTVSVRGGAAAGGAARSAVGGGTTATHAGSGVMASIGVAGRWTGDGGDGSRIKAFCRGRRYRLISCNINCLAGDVTACIDDLGIFLITAGRIIDLDHNCGIGADISDIGIPHVVGLVLLKVADSALLDP